MKKLNLLLGGLIVTLGATMASCSGDNVSPAFKTEQEKINFQAVCSALKCVAPVDFFDEQKLQERIEKYPVKDMTDFLLPD